MDIPPYSQAECDYLIGMTKVIRADAYDGLDARQTRHERSQRILAHPENADEPVEFRIDLRYNRIIYTFSISLLGKMDERELTGLCRYEIQDSPHKNPKWFEPREIASGVAHVHRYSHRAMTECGIWWRCASPLDVPTESKWTTQQFHALQGCFVGDMSIRFEDTRAAKIFWRHC